MIKLNSKNFLRQDYPIDLTRILKFSSFIKEFYLQRQFTTNYKVLNPTKYPMIFSREIITEEEIENKIIQYKFEIKDEIKENLANKKILKKILGKFLKDQTYIFKYKYYFKKHDIPDILNRQTIYKQTDQFIEDRNSEWSYVGKNRCPLIGVSSISGGGKTVFLRSYPLFFMGGDGFKKILPIYITFNELTNFSKRYDIDVDLTICLRVLWDFLNNIYENEGRTKLHIGYVKNFYMFAKTIIRELEQFDTWEVLDLLSEITNKEILLLVDEISKIEDELYRRSVITVLGSLTDSFKYMNVIISTLDHSTIEKYAIYSNRRIKYVNLRPLKDLYELLEEHPKYRNFKGLTNLQLAIYEISVLPIAVNYLTQELLKKQRKELEIINDLSLKEIYELINEFKVIQAILTKLKEAID